MKHEKRNAVDREVWLASHLGAGRERFPRSFSCPLLCLSQAHGVHRHGLRSGVLQRSVRERVRERKTRGRGQCPIDLRSHVRIPAVRSWWRTGRSTVRSIVLSTRRKRDLRHPAAMAVPGSAPASSISRHIRSVSNASPRGATGRRRSWIISFRTGETVNCSGIGGTGSRSVSHVTIIKQGMRIADHHTSTERTHDARRDVSRYCAEDNILWPIVFCSMRFPL